MRICGGKASGISLQSPRGDATRPATDSARQAIFSSLGDLYVDANVLDLFAGTGAYGIEALSRGAKSALFVENQRNAIECIRKNLSSLEKCLGKVDAKVLPKDFFTLRNFEINFRADLIFIDPPYSFFTDRAREILEIAKGLSISGSIIVIEAPGEFEVPEIEGLEALKRLGKRSRGKPSQIIFKKC